MSATALDSIRARGVVRLTFRQDGDVTRLADMREGGGYRVKFPVQHGPVEAVMVNTGGGMTGGDELEVSVAVGEGAFASFTTPAAEKIYAAVETPAQVAVSLEVGEGGTLHWVPQEAILFDKARFSRRFAVNMAESASLILAESLVFGRVASGEVLSSNAFADSWRIRRGNKLIFAEEVRLNGALSTHMLRPAVGKGARALATCLIVSQRAESLIEEARERLAGCRVEAGVSAFNGVLIARFLSQDPAALRTEFMQYLVWARGAPLSALW
jgi:urease accessory protein